MDVGVVLLLLSSWMMMMENVMGGLTEISGFHCMMRHSMRMNRQVHGRPQQTSPPFEFSFMDSKGQPTSYYEPGKIYTIRLVGFVHYRGLLLQSRLTNENGFLLGSLKGGRFIESPAWNGYGIRLQECDRHAKTADTVTHSDDTRKFVTQLEWTTDRDIGPVQFMLTIAEEDEIYWERWRPRTGFILPSSYRGQRLTIIDEVFTDEKAAMRLADTPIIGNERELSKNSQRIHGIRISDETNRQDRRFEPSPAEANLFGNTPSPSVVIFGRLNRSAQIAEHFIQKKQRFEEILRTLYAANLSAIENVLPFSRLPPSSSNNNNKNQAKAAAVNPRNIVQQNRGNVGQNRGAKIPESAGTDSGASLNPNEQFIEGHEKNLKDLMRQLKSDFEELKMDSQTASPTTTTHNLPTAHQQTFATSRIPESAKTDPNGLSKSHKPYSALVRRPISQAIPSSPVDEPIETLLVDFRNPIRRPSTTKKPAICSEDFCMNGAECVKDRDEDEGYRCDCKHGWTGTKCEEVDHCLNHSCVSGECINNSFNYTCECLPNFAGPLCTRNCGLDFCKHNGTCVEKHNGELGCKCPPGSSGQHCEREINECNFRRCKNAAKCIDKWNDYECICEPGWMGKNCDRPCQDIYGSCKLWKRQGQCELMREHTDFFDTNCALSCEQCIFSNSTAQTLRPIPTSLLPLAWMVGIWKADVNGTRNRTIDYPFDFMSNGYEEILMVSVEIPLMFGTPSINFTSIATSKLDPEDQHVLNGFLTIRNRPEETHLVAISSVSNSGTVLIEEGKLRGSSMTLKPQFQIVHPIVQQKLPNELSRTFLKNGEKLLQSISRKRFDGRNEVISKHYKKIATIQYL